MKLAASRKNPNSQIETKEQNLYRGGMQRYVGAPEVRNRTMPDMATVANKPFKDNAPKIKFDQPKPP